MLLANHANATSKLEAKASILCLALHIWKILIWLHLKYVDGSIKPHCFKLPQPNASVSHIDSELLTLD